jgi:hypothetical protein
MNFFTATILGFASLASATSQPKPRTIFEFSKGTWLENLASTRNGTILTGTLGGAAAELHLIDPFSSSLSTTSANSTIIQIIPNVNSILGIAEYETDIFAILASNYTSTAGIVAGSASIWSIDLRDIASGVKAKKITDLSDSKGPNGMATLNSGTVLIADSFADHIFKVDVHTGKSEIVLEDPSLVSNASLPLGIGANGLKVVNNNVYYTNLQLALVGRVPVDPTTGHATGAFTTLATNLTAVDDLAVTDDGVAFVARPYAKVIEKISLNGTVTHLADGHKKKQSAVSGATSVVLGRTSRDRGVVYIATMGGKTGENGDGELLGGAKIVAIDMY